MDNLVRRLKKGLVGRVKKESGAIEYTFDAKEVILTDLNEIRKYLMINHDIAAIDAMNVKRNTSSTSDSVYLSLFPHLLIDDSDWNGEIVNFLGQEYLGSFSITMKGGEREDLMIYPSDFSETSYTNGLKIVANPKGPIILLRKNEELDIVAYIRRGKPKEHAKFNCVKHATAIPSDEEGEGEHKFLIDVRSKYFPLEEKIDKKILKLIGKDSGGPTTADYLLSKAFENIGRQ